MKFHSSNIVSKRWAKEIENLKPIHHTSYYSLVRSSRLSAKLYALLATSNKFRGNFLRNLLMESLKTSFLSPILLPPPSIRTTRSPLKYKNAEIFIIRLSVTPDPWSLSDGNPARPKPRSKNAKRPLSDDNARRIIKAKAQYLSVLRRNQGPRAQTPKWIKRTPEQMVQYLEDDRNGHLYGKHVVAAIRHVRSLSQKTEGEYDMRMEMASFVEKLTFREMWSVLKEQKGWRQVRDGGFCFSLS